MYSKVVSFEAGVRNEKPQGRITCLPCTIWSPTPFTASSCLNGAAHTFERLGGLLYSRGPGKRNNDQGKPRGIQCGPTLRATAQGTCASRGIWTSMPLAGTLGSHWVSQLATLQPFLLPAEDTSLQDAKREVGRICKANGRINHRAQIRVHVQIELVHVASCVPSQPKATSQRSLHPSLPALMQTLETCLASASSSCTQASPNGTAPINGCKSL